MQTRAIMLNELLTLWERTKPSVLFVTHDLEEATALSDRVVVITAGPGTLIAVAQNNFDADRVFAAMLIIGLLALSAEAL